MRRGEAIRARRRTIAASGTAALAAVLAVAVWVQTADRLRDRQFRGRHDPQADTRVAEWLAVPHGARLVRLISYDAAGHPFASTTSLPPAK